MLVLKFEYLPPQIIRNMNEETHYAPPGRSSDEEVRRQSEDLAEAGYALEMLNAMPQIAAILNENRQIVFSNESLVGYLELIDHRDTVGMRPGEVVKCIFSKTSKNGCGTSENCRYCGAVNAILESQNQKKKVSRECRITTLIDGRHEFMDIQVTATPFDYKGKIYTIFSVDDISDKKRRLMLERIFFHDIVNIAGAIKGFSEVLKGNNDQEQIEECLDAMGKLSKELVEEIISQRTLHDAETGDLIAHITDINSTNLIKDTLSYLSKSEYAFGKQIVTEADNTNIYFSSDETLLKRVLINMLKNALEASSQGDIVRVRSEILGNNLVFSVNNPSEMSKDVKLQVFQRSFSTKGNNRGIGTYSIRILTERYLKGKVGFTSTRENGTTFFVYLPLEQIKPD